MGGSRGGGGRGSGPSPPPEKSQKYRSLSKTDRNPLENHDATNPVFNVGPPSARQMMVHL